MGLMQLPLDSDFEPKTVQVIPGHQVNVHLRPYSDLHIKLSTIGFHNVTELSNTSPLKSPGDECCSGQERELIYKQAPNGGQGIIKLKFLKPDKESFDIATVVVSVESQDDRYGLPS